MGTEERAAYLINFFKHFQETLAALRELVFEAFLKVLACPRGGFVANILKNQSRGAGRHPSNQTRDETIYLCGLSTRDENGPRRDS